MFIPVTATILTPITIIASITLTHVQETVSPRTSPKFVPRLNFSSIVSPEGAAGPAVNVDEYAVLGMAGGAAEDAGLLGAKADNAIAEAGEEGDDTAGEASPVQLEEGDDTASPVQLEMIAQSTQDGEDVAQDGADVVVGETGTHGVTVDVGQEDAGPEPDQASLAGRPGLHDLDIAAAPTAVAPTPEASVQSSLT